MNERDKIINTLKNTIINYDCGHAVIAGMHYTDKVFNVFADALITAGYGDVTEYKHRAEVAERAFDDIMTVFYDILKQLPIENETPFDEWKKQVLQQAEREIKIEKGMKYTAEEIKYAKRLKEMGFNWMARNKDDYLYAYGNKPIKLTSYWIRDRGIIGDIDGRDFRFITWQDKQPTNIDDIISS